MSQGVYTVAKPDAKTVVENMTSFVHGMLYRRLQSEVAKGFPLPQQLNNQFDKWYNTLQKQYSGNPDKATDPLIISQEMNNLHNKVRKYAKKNSLHLGRNLNMKMTSPEYEKLYSMFDQLRTVSP